WSSAPPGLRDYLDKNRAALELWREGTTRPDAIDHQPGGLAMDTALPLVQDVSLFARLGGVEGSRHEQAGAMVEAWTWHRAGLRASRHVGQHGVLIERLVGAGMLARAGERIGRWAADSRVDARLLRQALSDTLAALAMTPPLSNSLKLDYLIDLRDL